MKIYNTNISVLKSIECHQFHFVVAQFMLPSLLSMLLNSNQDYIEYFESNIRWFLGQVGVDAGMD